MKIEQLQPGIIICGDKFPEPVKVLSSKMIGTSRVKIEAVGINTNKYYDPVIPIQELIDLQEQKDLQFQFTGNPESVFLYLEAMKEALGDRVFDVIGDVLQGASLKDLILDAIANKRTIDDILAQMDKVPDVEAINKVKQASLEALATRHIDLSRINQEQRTAKENRLVPEYIERFFLRAAKYLKIKVEKRQNGFWRITNVPFELRNQPHEFKLKYGEVQREYLNFGFEKKATSKAQAEFVSSGHPLMEAILEHLFKQYQKEIEALAVLLWWKLK